MPCRGASLCCLWGLLMLITAKSGVVALQASMLSCHSKCVGSLWAGCTWGRTPLLAHLYTDCCWPLIEIAKHVALNVWNSCAICWLQGQLALIIMQCPCVPCAVSWVGLSPP